MFLRKLVRPILVCALLVSATPVNAWECFEENGAIWREGDIEVDVTCNEGICAVKAITPGVIQDRLFDGLVLSKYEKYKVVLSVPVEAEKTGENFVYEFHIKKGHIDGLHLRASYVNFKYGCIIQTDVYLDEKHNKALNDDA